MSNCSEEDCRLSINSSSDTDTDTNESQYTDDGEEIDDATRCCAVANACVAGYGDVAKFFIEKPKFYNLVNTKQLAQLIDTEELEEARNLIVTAENVYNAYRECMTLAHAKGDNVVVQTLIESIDGTFEL